jgi:phosphohistidine phosphatase SixA
VKLYVMRHGCAGEASSESYTERWRGLTLGGADTVRAIAREMLIQDEIPNFILANEYARTRETADIIGTILGVRVDTLDELMPAIPIKPLVDALLEDDTSKRIMLVGHTDNLNPFLEKATGVKDDKLAKGEVRRLKFDRDSGEAVEKWRLRPSDVGYEDEYDTILAGTEEPADGEPAA